MKLTKQKLNKIIKEEVQSLNENSKLDSAYENWNKANSKISSAISVIKDGNVKREFRNLLGQADELILKYVSYWWD